MSIENLLSKEDLSLQAEQYIHHRLRGKPYDPELSGCVVQIVSGNNPFRICDQTNYIDVSDPTVINTQLKAANKNINWHTMRGALVCLRKWGFSSTYDAANDRLKFDIVIHEIECIQTSPSDQPVIPETVSLLEASHLKNKFNRLKKFHIAEELNESHPIETALEEIDRERVNASEMTRFADHGHRRPQSIDASQESKANPYFWTYEMPNRQNQGDGQNFSATQPPHEIQSSLQDYNKHHYASLPENKEPFSYPEKFPSMVDPYKSQVIEEEEDEFNEYLAELEGGEITSKKPINKDAIEIEEVIVQQTVETIVPGKRKAIDVLNKKKEALNDPLSVGVKKIYRGPIIDNVSEQQKLIQARSIRSATKEGSETDLLNLLNAPESQDNKRRSAPVQVQERTLKPSLKKEKVAPVYNLNELKEFVDVSVSQPYSQILRVDNKHKVNQYQEIPRVRNTRVTVEQKNPNHYIFKTSDQEDVAEINTKEFNRSFKLIKFDKEPKQVSFVNDNIRDGQKIAPIQKIHQESRLVVKQASPSPNKSRSSRAENLTPSKIVENPLDKKISIDLSEFKLISWKPSSKNGLTKKGK